MSRYRPYCVQYPGALTWLHNGGVVPDRNWVVGLLHQLGYAQEAEAALRELPDEVSVEQLKEFGDRHGISRDELTSRMGGSP